MTILAIDPGTNCGYAFSSTREEIGGHGVWDLKPKRFEGGGMRFARLRSYLAELHKSVGLTAVYYEEVRRHKGVDAAHIYGGIVASIQEFCEAQDPKIPYTAKPVGEIKKFAAGKGNAKKDAMVAAVQKWGFSSVTDDNEADALALLMLARHEAIFE